MAGVLNTVIVVVAVVACVGFFVAYASYANYERQVRMLREDIEDAMYRKQRNTPSCKHLTKVAIDSVVTGEILCYWCPDCSKQIGL